MRILQLIHNQEGSGPYLKAQELASALAERGHAVTLVATSQRRRIRWEERSDGGVATWLAPDLLSGALRQGVDPVNGLRRALRAGGSRWDIVHAVDCRPAVLLPWLVLGGRGAVRVLSWYDLFAPDATVVERSGRTYAATAGRVEAWLDTAFRVRAAASTVVSEELGRRLRALGVPPEQIALIRVGVDTRQVQPGDRAAARASLGLPSEATVFIYVGSILPRDLVLLRDALTMVQASSGPGVITLLVGAATLPEADARAAGARILGRVDASTLRAALSAADAALLPMHLSLANRARWPSKIGDYLAAGLPLVATPVSDLASLAERAPFAMLASSDDVPGFASAMHRFLGMREAWPGMAAAARRFAETTLDIRAIAAAYESVFAQALSRRAGRRQGS